MRFIPFPVLFVASGVWAQPTGTVRCVWTDDTHAVAKLVPVQSDFEDRSVFSTYDNWSDPVRGGATIQVGLLSVSNHEVADDLFMVQPGELSAMRRSVANLDTQGNSIIQTTETVRWYDADTGAMLASHTSTLLWGAGGAAGTSWHVRQDDGFWSFLHLNLPTHIFYSEQETDIVGANSDAIGRITAGPNTLGSSTRFIHDFTSGQDIDLGSDQINLLLAVRATPAPTPGGLATLFASGALALRRRR